MKSISSILAVCAVTIMCGNRVGYADDSFMRLANCADPAVAIHGTNGQFIWRQALLQLSAANHAGKLVLFDGKALKVFNPNEYDSPATVRLERPPVALAISENGAIAWLESVSNEQNAPLVIHLLRGGNDKGGAAIERQQSNGHNE